MAINVIFWGTRGSYPQDGEAYHEFGGLTSCISIHQGRDIFILDGGSGLGKLSSYIQEKGIKNVHLFLSHLHMDHICGLPSFSPLWDKDFEIHIYCGKDVSAPFGGVEAALAAFYAPPYFPIPWKDFPSKRHYHDFDLGKSLHPQSTCQVDTIWLNHPGGAIGYRLNMGEKSIVYLSDTSHLEGAFERFIPFSQNAHLLIYDANFNENQFSQFSHYGHSTWEKACELARIARCDYLALHHHDYQKTDYDLRIEEQEAKALFPRAFAAKCSQRMVI
jgi:ribonuclease BN (tRNA processing enzyme)